MGISCDICKYSEMHDYLDRYYCHNPQHYRCGDFPVVENCEYGEIDESRYYNRYKVHKNLDNISKRLISDGLEKLLFGIRLKSMDEIVQEIRQLSDDIASYREPHKCETCAKEYCEAYANGCRGCNKWE